MVRRGLVVLLLIAGTFAVASPADAAAQYRYVRSDKQVVKVGRFANARVDCPARTQAISGGVEMNVINAEGFAVVSSFPFDDRDRNRRPDDGWSAVVSNQSVSKKVFRVHAVCARVGQYFYGKTSVDVANGSDANIGLGCPDSNLDTVVGGGGKISAPKDPTFALAVSGPTDDLLLGDADSDPDDFWRVSVNNTSGDPLKLTVFSICERDLSYDWAQFPTSNVVGATAGSAGCTTGPVVGGGGEVSADPEPGVVMQKSHPVDSNSTPDGVRDNAWNYGMRNDSGTPIDLITTSICRA